MSEIDEVSFKFPKDERLKSRKDIGLLFRSKQSVFAYPIKVMYRVVDDCDQLELFQSAFTVPKRTFKKAVDRNRLKRRMKESYRLHRNLFKKNCKSQGLCIQMMFIYIGKEDLSFSQVEKGVTKVLAKLQHELAHS